MRIGLMLYGSRQEPSRLRPFEDGEVDLKIGSCIGCLSLFGDAMKISGQSLSFTGKLNELPCGHRLNESRSGFDGDATAL